MRNVLLQHVSSVARGTDPRGTVLCGPTQHAMTAWFQFSCSLRTRLGTGGAKLAHKAEGRSGAVSSVDDEIGCLE